MLQQRSCSLVGMANLLLLTRGNFAVVVHGPVDCTNIFLRHVPDPLFSPDGLLDFSSDRFFSSRLTDMDVSLGKSEEKLAGCIEEVIDTCRPEILFVLGTCLSEVIGDDIEKISSQVSEKKKVKIVAVPTSGLHPDRQGEIADTFEKMILQNIRKGGRKIRGGVAVAGLSLDDGEVEEIRRVLGASGLKLLTVVREFITLDDWREAARGELIAVIDSAAHPSMISVLEDRCGVECVDVPIPFGIEESMAFYGEIFSRMGKARAPGRALDKERKKTEIAAADTAAAMKGKRVAYETGSALGFRAGQHAGEGMAHAAVFEEMQMDVELLVQGVDSPENREEIERALSAAGARYPYRIFQDPGRLTDILIEGSYDLVYCSDGRREQTLRAHVPFLPLGSIRPLLGGMRRNAAMIEGIMSSLFLKRYSKYG